MTTAGIWRGSRNGNSAIDTYQVDDGIVGSFKHNYMYGLPLRLAFGEDLIPDGTLLKVTVEVVWMED